MADIISIKQSDLPEMDKSESSDFEMTGRNTNTGVASRMQFPGIVLTDQQQQMLFNILNNSVTYDAAGNIVLKYGTKLLFEDATGATHHALSMPDYPLTGGDNGEVAHYFEVGNTFSHLNLNSDVDPEHGTHGTVDTPDGKKEIAYVEDLPQPDRRIYGDLSVVLGDGISFTLDGIRFIIQRIDTTTIEVKATSDNDVTFYATHRYAGNNTSETQRETFTATPEGTTIASIGVGQYVIAEFWSRINDCYDLVIGSDDDNLTMAWAEIKTSKIVS